jgi:peptidoglycan hydrolase-like protein with peptidoglycan-binding domain
MLDVEQTDASNPTVLDVVDFVNAYRALGGVVYLTYLPRWYWQNVLKSPLLAPLISLGLLLVSSQYTSYSDKGAGWNSYGGMNVTVWQYTNSGVLNGVHDVDWNAFRGTVADLKSLVATGALGGVNPLVRQGDQGAAVKLLQERLNLWGAAPQLAVDGAFGPKTYEAVKAFQAAHKLVVDGVVGQLTWLALNASPKGSGPSGGSSGGAPQPYPAPVHLKLGQISLELKWDAVMVDGKAVDSYSIRAYGLNGQLFVSEASATNSCTLAGLVPGWTYNINIWADGGPAAPPHAAIKVTV